MRVLAIPPNPYCVPDPAIAETVDRMAIIFGGFGDCMKLTGDKKK